MDSTSGTTDLTFKYSYDDNGNRHGGGAGNQGYDDDAENPWGSIFVIRDLLGRFPTK